MAIKIGGTTIVDDNQGLRITGLSTFTNITDSDSSTSGAIQITGGVGVAKNLFVGAGLSVTGIVTAASFKGSAQVGVATGGTYIGLATQFNFVGSGVSVTHQYNSNVGIATINFYATGSAPASSGVSDGVVFNSGIASVTSARLVGIGSTVLSLPSTAGKEYIIYSINASNVAAGNTEVNVIGAFDFIGSGTTERSYFAYNIPIPTGTSVELLRQPQVLNPSDKIVMRGTDYNRIGNDDVVEVYISYQEKTSSSYFGIGYNGVGIGTTSAIGIFTSTGSGSVIQSIRLVNRTDTGGYPASITVTSGINTIYLIDDLIVPKYSSVELLDTPKTLKTNDTIKIIVDEAEAIDVQVSGIVIS